MINIQVLSERKFLKNKGEQLLGIKLSGLKGKKNINKKINNICFAIDISSSMNDYTEKYNFQNNIFDQNMDLKKVPKMESRINLAKKSIVFALNNLNEEDIFSVVIFNHEAKTLIEPMKVKDGLDNVLKIIDNLFANGSTNLHSGWVLACNEVAKNYKKEYLNRIVLISDGETNQGEKDPQVIISDVSKVFKSGVSTTSVGVGSSFNEDLLSGMSNEGGGNFYYIKSSEDFIKTFNEELNGLNNLAAYDVKIKLILNEGILNKDLNNLKKENELTILPNIMKEKDFLWLNKLTVDKKIQNGNNIKIGLIEIEFKNEEGIVNNLKQDIIFNVVSKKDWLLSEENSELKMKETLLDIANKKEEAALKMKQGLYDEAKNILNIGASMLSSSAYASSEIFKEASATLNTTINEKDDQVLRKMIVTQSYNERR